jgi:hypothetical protein
MSLDVLPTSSFDNIIYCLSSNLIEFSNIFFGLFFRLHKALEC